MDAWLALSAVATRRRGMNHVCGSVRCRLVFQNFRQFSQLCEREESDDGGTQIGRGAISLRVGHFSSSGQ